MLLFIRSLLLILSCVCVLYLVSVLWFSTKRQFGFTSSCSESERAGCFNSNVFFSRMTVCVL